MFTTDYDDILAHEAALEERAKRFDLTTGFLGWAERQRKQRSE